jgi:hypothetical protein
MAFVPGVSFSLTSLDTQPFAAIFGIACIALVPTRRLPVTVWYLAIPALASLVIAMTSSTVAVGARSFVIYASPWIFACVAYLASQRKIEISRYIVFMIYLWAAIGLIQWLIDPRTFEFLVNTRTTGDRGVTSLAPEPSFYGLTIIHMWLTLLLIQPQTALKGHIVLLCIFQILILAQSTLAILVLFALLSIFALRNVRWIVACVVWFLAFFLMFDGGGGINSRVFYLINIALSNPSEILYLDASISERFYHVFLPLKHAISSGLMPHGFDAFAEVIDQGQNQYASFWWGAVQNKIMSGVGGAVFELGWFSLIYFFVFYRYLSRYEIISSFHKLVIGIGIFFVLLSSVTFSAPFFGLMIGIMAARKYASRKFVHPEGTKH